jgi:hydrogenase maturation protease
LRVLILGYGNVDRQDDGVAWHVLLEVMQRLGLPYPAQPDDEMPIQSGEYECQFHLQLTPELADEMGDFDKSVFIDAHTGNMPEEVHLEKVIPQYQSSPFTHHMTAATLLSLCDVVHHKTPETILVSVRGYEFQFTRTLSSRTRILVNDAADLIIGWVRQPVLTEENKHG